MLKAAAMSGYPCQLFRTGYGEAKERRRRLRAVDEREPFLRRQRDRLQSGARQRRCARFARGFVPRFAFADEDERQVGQRREIAAGANRSARRHDEDGRGGSRAR